MISNFEINNKETSIYRFQKTLDENLYIHFDKKEIFFEVESDDKHILLYGYAFDVRNPEQDIRKTLENLINLENIRETLYYLNGQFFLVYKELEQYYFVTDAVCITPVFLNHEHNVLRCEFNKGFEKYNSQMKLNLHSFEYERIPEPHNILKNENLERLILDLVTNQYKYFIDKSFTINFRSNMMSKGLIAILSPSLQGNKLYIRDNTEINRRVATFMTKEFNMELLEHNENITSEYLMNTHLMDYRKILIDDLLLSNNEKIDFRERNLLEDKSHRSFVVEYHLLNKIRYHNDPKENLFIYDPFNIRMIQNRIYRYNKHESFQPSLRIIQTLKPMLNYYDFSTGNTLQQKYIALKKENNNLRRELKSQGEYNQVLENLKSNGIEITSNLDAKYNGDSLVVQPISPNISSNDIFKISYKKEKPGMMMIETFFENKKNAHRIKLAVNGVEEDISKFLGGKFLDITDYLEITMHYERDYNTTSWQKAGKIRISEIN